MTILGLVLGMALTRREASGCFSAALLLGVKEQYPNLEPWLR